jgi:hypothetical protein
MTTSECNVRSPDYTNNVAYYSANGAMSRLTHRCEVLWLWLDWQRVPAVGNQTIERNMILMKPTDSIVDNSSEGVQSVEHRRLSTRGLAVRSLETTPLLDAWDERLAYTDSTEHALGRCGEAWFTVHSTSATGKCYQLPPHWHSPIACRYYWQPSGDRIAGKGSGMATARGRIRLYCQIDSVQWTCTVVRRNCRMPAVSPKFRGSSARWPILHAAALRN